MSTSHDDIPIALPYGLYETLINERLLQLIGLLPDAAAVSVQNIDPEESHIVLSRYVASALRDVLSSLRGETRILSQIEVCNALLSALQNLKTIAAEPGLHIPQSAEQLMAILEKPRAGHAVDNRQRTLTRPETPLSMSSLLTGTRLDPSLMSQLIKEIQTADRIDILCSFVKWSGTRVLESVLRTFTSRQNT